MDGSFPKGWALQKPQQTIEPAEFERRWRNGSLVATRKRDGNRAHIVTAGAATRIWSRNGTVDLTEKLPHIVARYTKAPTGRIIDGEVHTPDEGTENYQDAMNRDPRDVVFSPFDMLTIDGSTDNWGMERRTDWLGHMEDVLGSDPTVQGGGVFFHLPDNATYAEVLRRIEAAKCEGVVVWDRAGLHVPNRNGNTKRGAAWKIKPRQTEDLIVVGANACADPSLGAGSLKLARLVDGRLVPAGKVGSFEKTFDRVAALRRADRYVVEVSSYGVDERQNFVFGKITRIRPDLHADMGLTEAA